MMEPGNRDSPRDDKHGSRSPIFVPQVCFGPYHLSRDLFDSEVCRRFIGLDEAAGLAVLDGFPFRLLGVSGVHSNAVQNQGVCY